MQDETHKPAKGKRTNAAATVRPVLSFRAQPDLYARIKSRADASQRAVSEEIEGLVRLALEYADSQETEFIIRTIGGAISLAEITTGKKWKEDKDTAVMVDSAIASAGAFVLFPHIGKDMNDRVTKRASELGKVLGPRAAALHLGTPLEEMRKIGEQEENAYIMADAEKRARITAADLLRSDSSEPDVRTQTPPASVKSNRRKTKA